MTAERLLDPYRHGASPLHRAPAGLKLILALSLVLLVVLLPRSAWWAHAGVACVLLVAAVASRVAPRQLLLRLMLVEPFAVGVALLALAGPGGTLLFASMLAKSTLCLATMVLLTVTTRFTDLLRVLWRAGIPALLVTTLALMHRYLFVIVQEMGRMRRARRSRTFCDDRAGRWRGSADVAGQLFLRTSERAERVYLAMCARGWKT